MKSIRDQVIGFAAVAHFAQLAHSTASEGLRRPEDLALALDAVLCTDPQSADQVFGSIDRLRGGREISKLLLAGTVTERREAGLTQVSTYVGHLLRLATRLLANDAGLATLSGGIDKLNTTREVEGDSDTIRALAGLYTETISQLSPRILINGRPEHLRDSMNVAAIRSFLMAGVRSAVLWQQSGGRVWHFVVKRKSLLHELEALTPAASPSSDGDDNGGVAE